MEQTITKEYANENGKLKVTTTTITTEIEVEYFEPKDIEENKAKLEEKLATNVATINEQIEETKELLTKVEELGVAEALSANIISNE
jgi:Cdc6-like AAA superfamily ATPase